MPPREAPDSSSPSSSSVLRSVKEGAGHERARWTGDGRVEGRNEIQRETTECKHVVEEEVRRGGDVLVQCLVS